MTKLQREAEDRKRRLANTLLMEVLIDLRPQTTERDLVALLDDGPQVAVSSRTPWKE